jgi:hypothetical protein
MLEARIESSKGSLYYASEATPYDLEMLRLYVRDLTPRNARDDLTLEVKVDDSDPAAPDVATWLGRIAATGVHVARTRIASAR